MKYLLLVNGIRNFCLQEIAVLGKESRIQNSE